ncbi:MAG TPA: phosphopantetheine-binding protein [Bacteroidia bacterium]|jgi:acyl carrier protein|nr:phosphopantetheine-binding protein [Bacteroidia bacterium]
MDALIEKLKGQIIEQLNLAEIKPADINPDAPLFGDGLGLDSIDALELIVLLEKYYQIKIKNPADGKMIFESVRTMAAFIQSQGKA